MADDSRGVREGDWKTARFALESARGDVALAARRLREAAADPTRHGARLGRATGEDVRKTALFVERRLRVAEALETGEFGVCDTPGCVRPVRDYTTCRMCAGEPK